MTQQANFSIYIVLGLTFVINWFLFEFIYDQIIYRENRFLKKWKPSWTTVFRFFLVAAIITITFTIVLHWQYSRLYILSNAEAWLSALDVAWTHLVLVFPIGFFLVFVIYCVATLAVVLFQSNFLNGFFRLLPELASKVGDDEHYETRVMLIVPFIRAPKSRLFVFLILFPYRIFQCGGIFLLIWVFLDIVVSSAIAYPITYRVLKMLLVDTMNFQMFFFGSFDPNLGWQYPSTFGFTNLSNHVTTTANWLSQQPVVASILAFLGLVLTIIISLASIKKAVEKLLLKVEKSEKQKGD